MGTFMGHILPGTFFGIFSLWWTWSIFHKFFMFQRGITDMGMKGAGIMHRRTAIRYKNTLSFPCVCCYSQIPVEGILKIFMAFIGMTGEFATSYKDGQFVPLFHAQHMTMFFFFGLNGAMDIMQHYRIPLPPDLDYVSAILALAMEALLFFYHLHGRPPMDIQVHMLLFYVIVSGGVATAFEMQYRNNVLPALCRVYFAMLQSTWFYQVAFILYPPIGEHWDTGSHDQMMIVTLLFTWHNAAIFVFLLGAGILIYFRVKYMDKSDLQQTLYPSYAYLHDTTMDLGGKRDCEQAKNMIGETDDEEEV